MSPEVRLPVGPPEARPPVGPPEVRPPVGRLGGRYQLGRRLGCGSFGETYLAVDTATRTEVAVKLESTSSKHQLLLREAGLLRKLQGAPGIASVHYWAVEGDYNFMVMDLLGASLQTLFQLCGRRFCLKTVLTLADQMLYRIEYLHSKNVIHRDAKPDNFLMGHGAQARTVHLIDFGLSKRYRDAAQQHIPYRENKRLVGTACFASINAHLGIEQARRDDLEAIGHAVVYLCRGDLPWQGIRAKSKAEGHRRILEMKQSMSARDLCLGLPAVFPVYFSYCRALRFEARPDYGYLRRILKDLFIRQGFATDFAFEWSEATIGQEALPEPAVGSAGGSGGNADSIGSTCCSPPRLVAAAAAASSSSPPDGVGTPASQQAPGSSTGDQRKAGGLLRGAQQFLVNVSRCAAWMSVMN